MKKREWILRHAPFALRIVQRKEGKAAVIYRRRADAEGRDRLQRVAALSPLATTAARPLLRDAINKSEIAVDEHDATAPETNGNGALPAGPFHPLDETWGARVSCYALVAAGLRDGERLLRAAAHLRAADPTEAAWWLGLLSREDNLRPLRALRILTEAVE
ncbi:MAG TPA: hypothetical protein PKH77_11790 [Anaerolineae bacterium]|nr:hypothetical protein [Anaerolineae bacterium]